MGKINSRAKGHSLERRLAKVFRDLGYVNCRTSRLESKLRDDLGCDLCHTGNWNVQAKSVENLGSAHATLAKMPVEEGQTNLVFHKKNRSGVVVSLMEEDFIRILKLLIDNKLICT